VEEVDETTGKRWKVMGKGGWGQKEVDGDVEKKDKPKVSV
jgi:hypothetical protein